LTGGLQPWVGCVDNTHYRHFSWEVVMQANPYRAPDTQLSDGREQFGEVKILSAAGRLGRLRYIGYSVGVTLVAYIIGALLMAVTGWASGAMLGGFIGLLAMLAALVIGVMLTIQRCHDFNMSGWLSLLLIVPLAPLIFWIVPGTQGPNRFGDQPPPNTTGVVVLALIVPAIFVVGILAAIAIPAYVDYQKRAQAVQSQ
jgi:uncharacterized membrane protein YhaH (DUF805 family)